MIRKGDKVRIKTDYIGILASDYKKGDLATYMGDDYLEMFDGYGQSVCGRKDLEKIFEKVYVDEHNSGIIMREDYV